MSIFAGIEHKVGKKMRRPRITPGTYRLLVQSMEEGTTEKTKDDFLRINVKVVQASGPQSTTREGQPIPLLQPGTDTEIFIKEAPHDLHLPEIASVAAAIATSIDGKTVTNPSEVNASALEYMTSDEQPAKDVEIVVRYIPKPGKFWDDGTPICKIEAEGVLAK